jgi:hypothetical protein
MTLPVYVSGEESAAVPSDYPDQTRFFFHLIYCVQFGEIMSNN